MERIISKFHAHNKFERIKSNGQKETLKVPTSSKNSWRQTDNRNNQLAAGGKIIDKENWKKINAGHRSLRLL